MGRPYIIACMAGCSEATSCALPGRGGVAGLREL